LQLIDAQGRVIISRLTIKLRWLETSKLSAAMAYIPKKHTKYLPGG